MLNHREHDKARHYLELLDDARCNGQWQDIPELTRKVLKYSSQRQCLATTAQIERRIADHPLDTSSTSALSTGLTQLVPSLRSAIEKEKTFAEDAFQARVCLAWLYCTIGDASLALYSMPAAIDQVPEQLAQDGGITEQWTHVCVIKGAYIRGLSLEKEGKPREAARTYASVFHIVSNVPNLSTTPREHRHWQERLLARHCMLSAQHIKSNIGNSVELLSPVSPIPAGALMSSFRAYADLFERHAVTRGVGHESPHRVWATYYDTLSLLVQNGVVQPVFKSKLHQTSELRRIQMIYEEWVFLKEIKFPRADQSNSQIETWVDQVMANWRTMLAPSWHDEDFWGGGKASFSRSILDILYRAATRSFHSTRVLRHLFTVHAAQAEFRLAGKAMDSYFEILLKGKARTKKSGETEIGLDDDATALNAASAGIKMLCSYGRRDDVEKSLGIADTIESWLQRLHPKTPSDPVLSADDVPDERVQRSPGKPPVPGKALALGHHALGVSQSYWARLTYETESRSDLQAKAISNFRQAIDPCFGEEQNVELLYSLAFALAETRDIDNAIATVKRALASSASNQNSKGVSRTDFASKVGEDESNPDPDRRGSLVRCWHLLALLLSARENFSAATACCEAALDLYGSKSILYGDLKSLDVLKDTYLSEKKNIVEIKMTHLALQEVVDGPEEGVNASGELLGLYTKLFTHSEKPAPLKIVSRQESPARSANGTLKSFRGSILGLPTRPGSKSQKMKIQNEKNNAVSSISSYDGPADDDSDLPAFSLTTDKEDDHTVILQDPKHQANFLGRHESNKLRKRNSRKSMGSKRQSRASSPVTAKPETPRHHRHLLIPRSPQSAELLQQDEATLDQTYDGSAYDSTSVGVAISHDLPSIPTTPAATADPPNFFHGIPSTTENMNKRNPNPYPIAPKPHPSQPARSAPISHIESTLLPLPEPQYSAPELQRQALTLLIKIWLQIAGLYRRASMPSDAAGALSEATTHAKAIETAIAKDDRGASDEAFSTPGYGGLKSCGEIWADVLTEQGRLLVAKEDVDGASTALEKALAWYPDHCDATVELSNILLEIYSKSPTVAATHSLIPPDPTAKPILAALPSVPETTALSSAKPHSTLNPLLSSNTPNPDSDPTLLLSRLAARDRAYGLLSALTKSGSGWDCGEAWFAFARACEEIGEVGRARDALWWVVELEGGRGVRRVESLGVV